MKPTKNMNFNGHKIDGWKCSCGEIYYESAQAQRILLLNKLKNELIKAKLGRIKSNLILRMPKEIESALNLQEGEIVTIKLEKDYIKIIPA
jgi:hypothetical protein